MLGQKERVRIEGERERSVASADFGIYAETPNPLGLTHTVQQRT